MSDYIVRVDGQIPDAIYERELTEIVRCRDCKYMKYSGRCPNIIGAMPPDGFCAWGEKVVKE